VPEDTAGEIAKQIGTVTVQANVIPTMAGYVIGGGGNGGNGKPWLNHTHANGLWSVPSDNYLAILHKDEQIIPARQVQQNNRSYSSNLYVEKMFMNNGQDAQGLADRMAAQQRRDAQSLGN